MLVAHFGDLDLSLVDECSQVEMLVVFTAQSPKLRFVLTDVGHAPLLKMHAVE